MILALPSIFFLVFTNCCPITSRLICRSAFRQTGLVDVCLLFAFFVFTRKILRFSVHGHQFRLQRSGLRFESPPLPRNFPLLARNLEVTLQGSELLFCFLIYARGTG